MDSEKNTEVVENNPETVNKQRLWEKYRQWKQTYRQ